MSDIQSDMQGDLTVPGPAERAKLNAARAATGTETGFCSPATLLSTS